MTTIKMYLNYSSFHKLGKFAPAKGDIYDEAEIEIPANWQLGENPHGDDLIITDTGERFLPSDIQTDYAGNKTPVPYLIIGEPSRHKRVHLKAHIKNL